MVEGFRIFRPKFVTNIMPRFARAGLRRTKDQRGRLNPLKQAQAWLLHQLQAPHL